MPGPPPPPPMLAPVKKFVPVASAGGDNRNALLGQIQKGAKLKKTVTVDKSGPIVAGRVAGSEPTPSPSRSRGPPSATPSNKSSPDTSSSSPVSGSRPPGGFANITDELQFKLTLKKNKNSPIKETPKVVPTKEPSPPASSNSFVNELKAKKQSVISAHHIPSQPSSISDALANKSSLFNKSQLGAAPTVPSPPKVVNHGKPNLAPKPPPQLKVLGNNGNEGNNDNSLNGDSNRKIVARHQSMKSPRSPPVLSPSTPINSDNHFGTIRMNQQKLQELNFQAPMHKPAAQRPTIKPPPPPVPNRLPGTNLTNNYAKSTTAIHLLEQSLSAPRRLPNSGSSNNISSMDKLGSDQSDSSAPPLPPHRLSSQTRAPQPPVTHHAPEVPRRNSSMRNSIENGANGKHASSNNSVTKLVVDLEARYSLLFHNVSEFPAPRAFMNLEKSYPSKALRQANGI